MNWQVKQYSLIGAAAVVLGIFSNLFFMQEPSPQPRVPVLPPEWKIPAPVADDALLESIALIDQLNPWGISAELQVAQVDQAAEDERLAKDAREAEAQRAAAEAEARRLASTWRYMGSIQFGSRGAGFFVSGSGEARYLEVGDQLLGALSLAEVNGETAVLTTTNGRSDGDSEIRVRLFRESEFRYPQ